MTFSPHRRPDGNYLAHDGLGRKSTSGYDGCDVIDSDTTGHPTTPYTGAATGAAVLVVWS
jgi:hypothetical protein